MSKTTRRRIKKRKPKYGRIFISIVALCIFIYFVARLGIDLFYKEEKTYLVTTGNLNIENEYESMILRNELVIDTNLSGKITYFMNEGETVVKNNQIAEIFNDGSEAIAVESTEKEISRKKIEFDYNLLEYDINNLKNQILFNMNAKDYAEVPALKRNLSLKLERLDKLQVENKFLSNRTASYREKTIGEGVLLEGQKEAIYAPASGILTYKIDGYEDFLTIDNLYNINYDEMSGSSFDLKSLAKDTVQSKDKLFKIVDDSIYYLAAIITNEEIETYKNIQSLWVEIGGERLAGDVYDVFTNADKAVVVIRMKESFNDFYSKRMVSCNIVRENYKGIKIKMSSIVNQDGQIGVFALDKERKIYFVPVKILGYDDESAIVYNSQFYDSNQGVVRSIKLNQEIVNNAIQYKVGDRLD